MPSPLVWFEAGRQVSRLLSRGFCRSRGGSRNGLRRTLGLPYFAALAALTAAQRFLVASIILLRPAALSFRLGFGAGADGAVSFFAAAHLLRWASAIRARAAALMVRRFPAEPSDVAAVSVRPLGSIARSSAILSLIRDFCAS